MAPPASASSTSSQSRAFRPRPRPERGAVGGSAAHLGDFSAAPGTRVSHTARSQPERLYVTPRGRVLLVEYALGARSSS
jgi:hypothetical protein